MSDQSSMFYIVCHKSPCLTGLDLLPWHFKVCKQLGVFCQARAEALGKILPVARCVPVFGHSFSYCVTEKKKMKTSNLEGTVVSQPKNDSGQIQSPVLNKPTKRAKFKARSRKRRFIQCGHIDKGTERSRNPTPPHLQGPKVRPKVRAEDTHI